MISAKAITMKAKNLLSRPKPIQTKTTDMTFKAKARPRPEGHELAFKARAWQKTFEHDLARVSISREEFVDVAMNCLQWRKAAA